MQMTGLVRQAWARNRSGEEVDNLRPDIEPADPEAHPETGMQRRPASRQVLRLRIISKVRVPQCIPDPLGHTPSECAMTLDVSFQPTWSRVDQKEHGCSF